jgi:hypothetical protein
MRSFIVMAMFVASLSSGAWNGHIEDRDPDLDIRDIKAPGVNTDALTLHVKRIADSHEIQVKAMIDVPDVSDDQVRELVETSLKLSLFTDDDTGLIIVDDRP